MRKTKATNHQELPTAFDELCRMHWPIPIHDAVGADNAQEMIDALVMLRQRSKGQEQYLETLSTLMEAYEDEHYPINTGRVDPIDTLKYLMEGRRMSASDLGRLLGNRSLGSAILRRQRQISRAAAIKLGAHFKVNPALFMGL